MVEQCRGVPHFTPRSGEGGWGAARADLSRAVARPRGRGEVQPAVADPVGRRVSSWDVIRRCGAPAELHAAGLPEPVTRMVRWCEADRAALVLGSAQPAAAADQMAADVAGLEVVRRRSGGSAVVIGPGRLVWADVVLPAGDRLWADDVGVAPRWLGGCWARALLTLGIPGARVHQGGLDRGRWGALVCFAGVGPGEVVVAGRKAVGVSQRRTRAGALFQCAVLLRWDVTEAVAGLALSPGERARAALELVDAAAGLEALAGRPVAATELEQAFIAELP